MAFAVMSGDDLPARIQLGFSKVYAVGSGKDKAITAVPEQVRKTAERPGQGVFPDVRGVWVGRVYESGR